MIRTVGCLHAVVVPIRSESDCRSGRAAIRLVGAAAANHSRVHETFKGHRRLAGVETTIARKTCTVCLTGSQAWRSIW
jgi:hypothetical protein